ncbi:MAG: aldo/keto reductase [Deltaproteobacteria bacterium]|nr:aldo/keto reductase [Deltaproteobacteria bacterium]
MNQRPFGGTGLTVSELGLGCARIGGIFQAGSEDFADLIALAVERGVTFFDTADMYSQGESEALLGRVLRGRRDRVVLASKVGYKLPAQRRLIARVKPFVRPVVKLLGLKRENLPSSVRGQPSQDFTPAYVRRAVEGSLTRLRTDHLDFLQLHSPPREVIVAGAFREALEGLVREGKIRHWGIACDTVGDAEAALRQPGLAGVQITVNLLEQGALTALLPACARQRVGVIAREIFSNGLLLKSPPPADLASYVKTPEEGERRRRQLAALARLQQEHGVSAGQLAVQRALTAPGVSVALIGARTRAQLEGALAFAQGPRVPVEALTAIGAVA